MSLCRYRTQALVGPWRASQKEAVADAVKAGQACHDGFAPIRWLVPGEIEKESRKAAA